MPNKPKILTVSEFRKTKRLSKGQIVYFDKKQWSNLTRGIEPSRGTVPSKTVTLTLTDFPGVDGGFGEFGCPIECDGPLSGIGDGEVRCNCTGDVTPPEIDPPELEYCFIKLGKNGSASCGGHCRKNPFSDSAPKRSCRLGTWIVPSRGIAGAKVVVLA